MDIYNINIDSKNERIKVNIPKNPLGLCIIIPSGQMGKFDEEGAEGELELYSFLFSILPSIGYGVIQPDMPLREDKKNPATSEHLLKRDIVLKKCLELHLVKEFNWEQIVLIGVSLGGQVVLNNLNNPYAGVLLIGCVIDSELPRIELVNNVHLLYGSHDYIAYVDDTGGLFPISPQEYYITSIKFLVEAGIKNASCTILDGYGHTLAIKEKTKENAIEIIKLQLMDWINKTEKAVTKNE